MPRWLGLLAVPLVLLGLAGCEPRVAIEAPEKPITINLNIKIEHELRVKLEKDVDEMISKNKGLF